MTARDGIELHDTNKVEESTIIEENNERGIVPGGDISEPSPSCSKEEGSCKVGQGEAEETLSGPVVIQLDHDYCVAGKGEAGGEGEGKDKEENEIQEAEETPPKKGRKKSPGKNTEKPKTRRRRKTTDKLSEKRNSESIENGNDVIPDANDVMSRDDTSSKNDMENDDTEECSLMAEKKKPQRRKVGYVIVTEEDEEEEQASGSTFFGGTSVAPKEAFECICGLKSSVDAEKDEKSRVQCLNCGLWQHPECVKYDLTDAYRGPYLCPHCHVVSVRTPLF